MKKLVLILCFLLVILASSCFLQKKEQPVNLDIFSSVGSDVEWAMIIDPYAAFYEEPSKSSAVKSHGRRADILEVRGKRIVISNPKNIVWYEFEKGWLESSSISVYSNKLQAEHASQKALQ